MRRLFKLLSRGVEAIESVAGLMTRIKLQLEKIDERIDLLDRRCSLIMNEVYQRDLPEANPRRSPCSECRFWQWDMKEWRCMQMMKQTDGDSIICKYALRKGTCSEFRRR